MKTSTTIIIISTLASVFSVGIAIVDKQWTMDAEGKMKTLSEQVDIFAHNVDVKYGKGTWDKLLIQSRKACHRGLVDYVWMAEHYEKQARELAQQKGIQI